jgi:hypothetical protein
MQYEINALKIIAWLINRQQLGIVDAGILFHKLPNLET